MEYVYAALMLHKLKKDINVLSLLLCYPNFLPHRPPSIRLTKRFGKVGVVEKDVISPGGNRLIQRYSILTGNFHISDKIILRIRSGKKIHLDEGSRLPLHGYQNPDLAGFGRSGYRNAGSLFEIAPLNRLFILGRCS